ncbi:transglycosylase domain-containing protein [Pseudothioglobus sp. nBUS_23]|uniref:transglycosylase domain-containing protein n=1 Tax=Pseudothioglobus sp. nBUS_23 TaxID=3395318 RepID=UPI003EB6A65F
MQLIKKRFFKIAVILLLATLTVYIFKLNIEVKAEFSKPLEPPSNVNQIEYGLDEYPENLINMLLMVEDQSFYSHHGVDFKEIARVLYGYLFEDKALRGASTISQQLIKNSLLSREKTLSRKLEEALMAILLEASYDKDLILERYMNTVYLAQRGDVAFHGFASGSLFYFDKNVEDLSLEEMATLVALLKGPTYLNPDNYPERLNKRVNMILSMHKKYKRIIN